MPTATPTTRRPARACPLLAAGLALCAAGPLDAEEERAAAGGWTRSVEELASLTLQPAEDAQLRNVLGLAADPIDEPLVTDRPDFTESAEAVPLGRAQIEMGYTYTYDNDDGLLVSHSAPELLLRLGIARNVELRIEWEGYTRSRQGDERIEGLADMGLGVKVKLLEQRGARPHLAALLATSLPTGEADISSDDYNPKLGLLWAYDLSESLALGGNVNVEWPTGESGAQFLQSSASVALGAGLTEQLGAYVEWFSFFGADEDGKPAHTINTGLTYLLTNNLQLDARVGFGLSEAADDFFTGLGLAWRF